MNALEVVSAMTDAINGMRWDAAGALMTDDFTATGLAPITLNKQARLGGEQAWHAACPDRHISLENAREEGGVVKATLKVSGTQTATLTLPAVPPIPATGKSYTVTGNLTATVRGEQVASMAQEATSPGPFEQMGVPMPRP